MESVRYFWAPLVQFPILLELVAAVNTIAGISMAQSADLAPDYTNRCIPPFLDEKIFSKSNLDSKFELCLKSNRKYVYTWKERAKLADDHHRYYQAKKAEFKKKAKRLSKKATLI
jgi:hypothetical protein